MKDMKLLSKQEGIWLLDFVRSSLTDYLNGESHLLQKNPRSMNLLYKKNYGIFFAFFKNSITRGCFGNPYPKSSIIETVQSMMSKEALEDPRFSPLSLKELREIQIEVSILTAPKPIEPNQIEIGSHGLILECNEHKSLFLPKVALENRWTTRILLEELCLKANLHKNAWKKEAKLFSFRAQTF